MPSISAIFFDLDGTLVDSSIGIHNAFTHTFKELGVPSPDAKTIRGFMGPPLKVVLQHVFPRSKSQRLCRYTALTTRKKASTKRNSSPNNGITPRTFTKLPSLHHYNKEYSYCS